MRWQPMILASLLFLAPLSAAPPKAGYHGKVTVENPTRLDWTFVLSSRSLPKPPANWLAKDYDSAKQTYELYVPKNTRGPLPAILFISPSNDPAGWTACKKLCESKGIVFISPRAAGNNVNPRQRVRIVLDVLDDVRRKLKLDPDRTYIGGFSGGGRIACAIGYALPEYFGGLMPVCAGGDVRGEAWLQHRAIDRLSVALLTGEKDFNRGECERLWGKFLPALGIRTKVWTDKGMGHAISGEKTLAEAWAWLEQGLKTRQVLAKKYPASRASSESRLDQAKAILAEGKAKLKQPKTMYPGLMLLQGVHKRWPDLQPGKDAELLLGDYDSKTDKPWEKEDLDEQRRYMLAKARALDAYVSGPLSPQYAKMRPDMAKQAIKLWEQLVTDSPASAAGKEGKKRIEALKKLVE